MISADVALVAFEASDLLDMASFDALYFLYTASCVGDNKGLVDASCGQFLHNTGVLGDPYPGNDLSLKKTLHGKSAASAFAWAPTSALVPYTYLDASALAIPLPFGYISNIQAFVALALAYGDTLDTQAFVALASASASALAGYIAVVR